ncbi:MAG: DUF11 domain-containing protein, partial [Gammaproteobacteria bacterium]|nr:DUF11 domain-containing protein [Gammaproteobacteria bacterium]
MLSRYIKWIVLCLAVTYPLTGDASRYQIFDLGIDFHAVAIEEVRYKDGSQANIINVRVAGNINNQAVYSEQLLDIPANGGGTIGFKPPVVLALNVSDIANPTTTLFTATQSHATAMNINGTVVGWIVDASGKEYGAYWKIESDGVQRLHVLNPHPSDAGRQVSVRAYSIDNRDNIVGYSSYIDASSGLFRRPMAWQYDSATGSGLYKPKDLGNPITGNKDAAGNDIRFFSFESTTRQGVALKIREGFAVGLWKNPKNNYPTPVIWNIDGVDIDAFSEILQSFRNKNTRAIVSDLVAANYVVGWTVDSLLEGITNEDQLYSIALEETNFNSLVTNRKAARWFAITRQVPGTTRIEVTGYDMLEDIGNLGVADAVKITALSPSNFRFGGSAVLPTPTAHAQAIFYSSQCGLQNANHLHNTQDTTRTAWDLTAITSMSSLSITDKVANVYDAWFAGLGTDLTNPSTNHGFVMMPASIPLDLSVTITASARSLIVGENLTYTITVTNRTQSPTDRATCVNVEFINPSGFTVTDATSFRGTCEISFAKTNCLIPDILNGEQGTIVLKATPRPMLADRNDNIAVVKVSSSETGYNFNRDFPTKPDSFPYDLDDTNNIAQIATDVKREGCFIATVAYGSYLTPQVQELRVFRDSVLMTNAVGRWLVDRYYQFSPSAAQWIQGRPWARTTTRVLLTPTVYAILHPLWTLAIVLLTLMIGALFQR